MIGGARRENDIIGKAIYAALVYSMIIKRKEILNKSPGIHRGIQ